MKPPNRPLQPAAELRGVLERDVHSAIEKLQARRGIDVHAVRKHVKHARAIVRLLSNELSEASYQRINRGLRDAARLLSGTRDAEVLLATITRLERKHKAHSLRPLREALEREQRQSRHAAAISRPTTLAKQRLTILSKSITKIDAASADWMAIIAAVAHTYRRARKAARRALCEPSSDNLHEWRKQVKYLWHQVQVLTPVAPRPLQRMARDLHRLADHLGDHHDLSLLEARIEKGKEIAADDIEDLKTLLGRQRARLESKASNAGKRLFKAKPKQFERKLRQRSA